AGRPRHDFGDLYRELARENLSKNRHFMMEYFRVSGVPHAQSFGRNTELKRFAKYFDYLRDADGAAAELDPAYVYTAIDREAEDALLHEHEADDGGGFPTDRAIDLAGAPDSKEHGDRLTGLHSLGALLPFPHFL